MLEYLLKPYRDYESWQIWLEIIAAVFGLMSTFFSIRRKIWVYPTGIISTLLYVFLLFRFNLLGDMLVNFYYTVMSIYGWVVWAKHQNPAEQVIIAHTTRKEWRQATALFLFTAVGVYLIYHFKPLLDAWMAGTSAQNSAEFTWSNWLDVLTTSIFLVGMWLMARRKIENWVFWIIGDFICIPMFLHKGLGITAMQYLVFTAMAIIGYRQWQKTSRQNSEKSVTI